jgi:hypothetical protein
MAAYLRGLVPAQLVTLGTEGTYMDSENVAWNPGVHEAGRAAWKM